MGRALTSMDLSCPSHWPPFGDIQHPDTGAEPADPEVPWMLLKHVADQKAQRLIPGVEMREQGAWLAVTAG